MKRKIEVEQLVSEEELAHQLASTSRSAAAFVAEVGASNAMAFLQIFAGRTMHFPHASTILKSAITAYIRKELDGTYKGRKERRAALRKTQKALEELGIRISRQQIERIFKAKKWVQ